MAVAIEDEWTDDVRTAWISLYTFISALMKREMGITNPNEDEDDISQQSVQTTDSCNAPQVADESNDS